MDRPGNAATSEPSSRLGTPTGEDRRGLQTGLPSPANGMGGEDPINSAFAAHLQKAVVSPGGTGRPRTTSNAGTSPSPLHMSALPTTPPTDKIPLPSQADNQQQTPSRQPSSHLTPSSPTTSTTASPRPRQTSTSIAAAKSLAADSTGVDSIFRLLPRETRPALMAMLTVEPTLRCTLSDLLRGLGRDTLVCKCGGEACGGGANTPPTEPGSAVSSRRGSPDGGEDEEEVDLGDEWVKGIACCSHHPIGSGKQMGHDHVKIEGGEETKKKRFFH
jgi:hypothetical protein